MSDPLHMMPRVNANRPPPSPSAAEYERTLRGLSNAELAREYRQLGAAMILAACEIERRQLAEKTREG